MLLQTLINPAFFSRLWKYSESGRESGNQENSSYSATDKPKSTNPKFQSLRAEARKRTL
jgi:hypothetical protein